jgi:hypothetical protein
MKEQELARLAMEKEELEFKPVNNVKEKVELFKCIRWDLECISRYKKLVMFAEDKVKSFKKARNAKLVMVRNYKRSQKLLKFLLKEVLTTDIPLHFTERVINW